MGESPTDVHPQLENFNDYFVETWLADDAKMPVDIWNVDGEDQKRTSNHVEGWNLKFTKLVRKHHPNIFEFVDSMRKEQAARELKAAQQRRSTSSSTGPSHSSNRSTRTESVLCTTVSAYGWAFAQTRTTVSDIKLPTWNNNYPIQNNNYLNYKQFSLYILGPSTLSTDSHLNISYNGTCLTEHDVASPSLKALIPPQLNISYNGTCLTEHDVASPTLKALRPSQLDI